MTLQTAIRIIRFATVTSALLVLAAIPFYFMSFKNMAFMALYGLLTVLAIIVTLGKVHWTRYIIRKIKYPGVLFEVCTSSGYFRNANINVSNEVLDDLYKPTCDSETFLLDNNLSADIYRVSSNTSLIMGLFYWLPIASVFALQYNGYKSWQILYPTLLAGLAISGLVTFYLKTKKDRSVAPTYSFSHRGLEAPDLLVPWHNLYSWETIQPTRKGEQKKIELRFTEELDGHQTYTIDTKGLAESLTNLNILLTHYKYKYGYTAELA